MMNFTCPHPGMVRRKTLRMALHNYQLFKLHYLHIRSLIVCSHTFILLILKGLVVCKFRDLYFTFVVASVT